MPRSLLAAVLATLALLSASTPAFAEIPPAPDRQRGEGPFERLILRGGILVDGTGAPPIGPVDIVVEGARIARIETVGYPGVAIAAEDRP